MSFLLRFLPSLGGLGSLFNPWIIAIGMAVVGSAFFYGMHIESARHDAYVAKADALAAIQAAKTAQTIADHKRLKEKADETNRADLARMSADLELADERLRVARTQASRRIMPAAPGGPSGNQRICFTRDTLDSEISGAINRTIERHAKRNLELASEGQRAVDVANLCRTWAKGFQ